MKYCIEKLNMKRGQRVMQLAFGSGFKCNSAVWICLNNRPFIDSKNQKKKSDKKKD